MFSEDPLAQESKINSKKGVIENINEKFSLSGFVHNPVRNFTKSLKNNSSGFVQGNFSEHFLTLPHEEFLPKLDTFIEQMSVLSPEERSGWVCGLGHGVLKTTPQENVKEFVQRIRASF